MADPVGLIPVRKEDRRAGCASSRPGGCDAMRNIKCVEIGRFDALRPGPLAAVGRGWRALANRRATFTRPGCHWLEAI